MANRVEKLISDAVGIEYFPNPSRLQIRKFEEGKLVKYALVNLNDDEVRSLGRQIKLFASQLDWETIQGDSSCFSRNRLLKMAAKTEKTPR